MIILSIPFGLGPYAAKIKKKLRTIANYQFKVLTLQRKAVQCFGSAAGIIKMREESPGSIGRSTSENGSYWRQ